MKMLYRFSIVLTNDKTLDFYFEDYSESKSLVDMCFREGYMLKVTPAEIYSREDD